MSLFLIFHMNSGAHVTNSLLSQRRSLHAHVHPTKVSSNQHRCHVSLFSVPVVDVHVKHGSSFKLWHQCRYKASDCFKHSVSESFFRSVKEHWEGMTLIWSSHSHGLQGTANQKTAILKEGWLQAYPVKVESGVCFWATGRQEVDKTVLIWLIFSSVVIYSRHRFFWALLHFQSSHSWVCCGLEALIILKVLTTSIKSLCRTNPPSLLLPLPVLLLLFKSEQTVR